MNFFDFIKELRKGKPDPKKAAKAMRILGWICIISGVWNFAFFFFAPIEIMPFKLPPSYPYFALISFTILGALFFYSARLIGDMSARGKIAGQLALLLLIVLMVTFMFLFSPRDMAPLFGERVLIIFFFFIVIFSLQFAVPIFYGIRYLGRLPAIDDEVARDRLLREMRAKDLREERTIGGLDARPRYKDALLPFGVLGTGALFIAILMAAFIVFGQIGGVVTFPILFVLAFLFIFIAPVAYNHSPSSFEKQRTVIESFTGGGSISLFSGTWPFFRLLVYEDGVEIRFMFHRFFIPYAEMGDIPEKVGFFSMGILFESDLPGVPSGIRYQGFGMKNILKLINHYRNAM